MLKSSITIRRRQYHEHDRAQQRQTSPQQGRNEQVEPDGALHRRYCGWVHFCADVGVFSYADDEESRNDKKRLENYCKQLQQLGYDAVAEIGFRNRVKEIQRIVKETQANMLIMGAHRHKGLKDYFFGETIEAVRHALDIPVLIVNVKE